MTACASRKRRSAAAASVMPRNSPMSAPAMKPLFLPERSTTPLGGSRSMRASTSLSSTSTSSLSVLALPPALSRTSQATPLSSRASFQCRQASPDCPPPDRGPSSRSRAARTSQTFPMRCLHRLDQHGAALPATDAFGRYALLDAEPSHRVDQMQHNAVAARTDGMAEPDCAAVDIELVALDTPCRAIEMQHFAAERLVLPGAQAGQHLRGEGFVQLPQPDVAERKAVPAQDRRGAQHRPQSHDGWIERRPFAVHDHRARLQTMLLHRVFRRQDQPRGAVGDLRAVARRDLAPRTLESG